MGRGRNSLCFLDTFLFDGIMNKGGGGDMVSAIDQYNNHFAWFDLIL